METSTAFKALFWEIMPALDAGRSLAIGEVHQHIEDGTLFEWLRSELGEDYYPSGFFEVGQELRPLALETLANYANTIDSRRKLGVESNGLLLLAAYCFEYLQQRV